MLFINVSISQYATGPSLNTQEDSNQAKFFLLDCVSRVNNSITSCFILMIYSSSFLFSLLDEDLGRNIAFLTRFTFFFNHVKYIIAMFYSEVIYLTFQVEISRRV